MTLQVTTSIFKKGGHHSRTPSTISAHAQATENKKLTQRKDFQKMKRKFRFFTLMLALCMFVGTLPAYAVNPYGSVTLTFTSEEDVDLSGIVVSVYEAVPETTTDNYTVYNETLSFTVETNAQGIATFAKPSQYCSVSVELETIPSGMGVSTETKFFTSSQTHMDVIVSSINRANVALQGSNIVATLYAADDMRVYANYIPVQSPNTYATMAWKQLKATPTVYISGNLVNGTDQIPFSIPIDVSKTDIIKKYEILNYYNMISEEEMILGQCRALVAKENASLLTYTAKQKIKAYRNKLLSIPNEEIILSSNTKSQQFDAVTSNKNTALIDSVLQSTEKQSSIASIGYEKTNIAAHVYSVVPCDNSFIDDVAEEMLNIYDYFITDIGFREPRNTLTLVTTPVEVEITDTATMTGDAVYGDTSLVDNVPKIRLNIEFIHDGYITDRWKTTLAHEYQHAIQYAYQEDGFDSWLAESFANFASAMYAMNAIDNTNPNDGYAFHSNEYVLGIQSYFNTTSTSLSENTANTARRYSMLFPLYLYQNVGNNSWYIIKNTYEAEHESEYAPWIYEYDLIDSAIKEWDDTRSISTVFEEFARDNILPSITYGGWYDSDWGKPTFREYSMDETPSGATDPITLDEMGVDYYQITDLSDSELAITFEVTSGDYENLTFWTAVHNGVSMYSNNQFINPQQYIATSNRFTIVYFHGAPSHPYYSVAAINRSIAWDDVVVYRTTISY